MQSFIQQYKQKSHTERNQQLTDPFLNGSFGARKQEVVYRNDVPYHHNHS
jgi:hypothetical protein